MEQIHQQRLAKLARTLLFSSSGDRIEIDGKVLDFNMGWYGIKQSSDPFDDDDDDLKEVKPCEAYECGTTCCFAGFAPYIFPECREFRFWDEVVTFVTGESTPIWHFLFNPSWPNNPFQAAARALTLLKTGIPDDYDFHSLFFSELSKDELVAELEVFIN